jgi:hypothetical protein
MTVNQYFQNFSANNEQNLLHDLTIEAIRQKGYDLYYVVRTSENKDEVYREEQYATFEDNYQIEMYIKSIDGFGGDGSFLSKFGLEIRDQVQFSVAQRVFANTITSSNSSILRPREGDIVYAPMLKRIFEIKNVDNRAEFYPLGTLPVFGMTCEVFEYSNEIFKTGIEDLDSLNTTRSTAEESYYILNENDSPLTNEANVELIMNEFNFEDNDSASRNKVIDDRADGIIDFTEDNPFGES